MKRRVCFRKCAGLVLLLGLATLLSASVCWGEEGVYHECTLKKVTLDGNDVVLMLALQDGQARVYDASLRYAAGNVPGRSNTVCIIKEHRLKLADGRLSGAIRIQTPIHGGPGVATEKMELDIALDKGGTYTVSSGRPEEPYKVEGRVTIEEADDGVLVWLPDTLRLETRLKQNDGGRLMSVPAAWGWKKKGRLDPQTDNRLGLAFVLDRATKTIRSASVSAKSYNRASHQIDVSQLAFDGTRLDGEIGITLVADSEYPLHGQPMAGTIKLGVRLDGSDRGGSFSALFGVEKQRQGQVAIRPASEEQMGVFNLNALIQPDQTPWRAYLVMGDEIYRENGQLLYRPRGKAPALFDPAKVDPVTYALSPRPSADWIKPDFDDSCWPRFVAGELADFLGGWDGGRTIAPLPSRSPCLRTSFGIEEPERVTDLTLKLIFKGGAVVYVNGQEIGRGYMPPGEIHPLTPAEDYPREACVTDDGVTALPPVAQGSSAPAKLSARYDLWMRTVVLNVPSRVLVKGRNTIAIDLHAVSKTDPRQFPVWSHVGLREVTLTSAKRAGSIPYAAAVQATRVWSANPVDQIAETPTAHSFVNGFGVHMNYPYWVYCANGVSVRGIAQGNPFDPVLPVKLAMPRNGVGSGQTVLSDPGGLWGVTAVLEPLRGPGGAILPAGAVQIRYAVQQRRFVHYCDALMEQAPQGARTVPVWLVIQAPEEQAPGWYLSTLRLTANEKQFRVPVQVLVTGYRLPDARDFSQAIGMTESPETVAQQYGVEPWSDAHFRLLEKSFALLGQVGNDVVHVPVIISSVGGMGVVVSGIQRTETIRETLLAGRDSSGAGMVPLDYSWQPLVRWVKTEQGLKPDLTILDKYLDSYAKYCAPPRGLNLCIWEPSCEKAFVDAYNSGRIPTRGYVKYAPPKVLVWDPATRTAAEHTPPMISDDGGEAFWKPLLDGVRQLVVKRGWSERSIMVGLGSDIRPEQKTVELLIQWAPYARWDILSHFHADPAPKDGKLITYRATEVGIREQPKPPVLGQTLQAFETRVKSPYEFLDLSTDRQGHSEISPPWCFHTLTAAGVGLGGIGLDFWMARDGGPKSSSFFSRVECLTVPGPDGAVPTVRFQMFREGAQNAEIKTVIVRAYLEMSAEQRKPYRELLEEFHRRMFWGGGSRLAQSELCYDWPAYVARLQRAAAELAGEKSEAKWEEPPE